VNSWRYTFLVVRGWTWSTKYSMAVQLSHHNRIATHIAGDVNASHSTLGAVVAEAIMNREYPYWSVRVNAMTADGITIGVASLTEQPSLLRRLGSSRESFGYNCYATLWHQNLRIPYGHPYCAGDVVGVYLDYQKRQLAFYVNNKYLNCASQDVALFSGSPLHLAVTMSYDGDSVTVLPPQRQPPSKRKSAPNIRA
jgi:hypothetical protein